MPQGKTPRTAPDVDSPRPHGNRSKAGVVSVVSITELILRRSRPPDYAAENHALIALTRELATSPEGILQSLAETALALCGAQSAALTFLEADGYVENFHWRAVAGEWAPHLGQKTQRDLDPSGAVLDRKVALLCSHLEQDYPAFGQIMPPVEEALLVPFFIKGEAVGTIWVVFHEEHRRFDPEDLRVLTNLADFAGAAYQTWLSLDDAQLVAAIVEFSDDAVFSKNLDGIITSWNRGAERLFGYSAKETIGKPGTILMPPEFQNEEPGILERIRRGERVEHYETVRRRKDGTHLNISLTVSPIKNADGKVVGASKIARDITERKRSESQIAILAREAEHRAKNVLATVQATVHLTQADTPDGMKDAITGRIQALANVHSLFVQSRWTGADVHNLVTQELSPYCRDGETRTRIDGPKLFLETNAAQSLAIALHELATNAAKYGALSTPHGRVQVEWSRAADGPFVLRWTETDGPVVTPPMRQGFGTRVMESLIRGQLKGELRCDWCTEGLICEIILPLDG